MIFIYVTFRIYCEGEIMDVDVTQSEGDLPDSNKSEHLKGHLVRPSKIELVLHPNNLFYMLVEL